MWWVSEFEEKREFNVIVLSPGGELCFIRGCKPTKNQKIIPLSHVIIKIQSLKPPARTPSTPRAVKTRKKIRFKKLLTFNKRSTIQVDRNHGGAFLTKSGKGLKNKKKI
jgi:hypothetical protein